MKLLLNNHQDFASSRLRVSQKVGSMRRRHSPRDGKLSAGIVGRPPEAKKRAPKSSKLDKYKDDITQQLLNSHHLTATRIYREIRDLLGHIQLPEILSGKTVLNREPGFLICPFPPGEGHLHPPAFWRRSSSGAGDPPTKNARRPLNPHRNSRG